MALIRKIFKGKGNISAQVIADSISIKGIRLTTLELIYPLFIHNQFLTHRVFSRNTASMRAIPINKMIADVKRNMAMPIYWGKNRSGMRADVEINQKVLIGGKQLCPDFAWIEACDKIIEVAQAFEKAGYHKQIVNRLLTPFSMTKVVCTATEWNNFFNLRLHNDAQPEMQELALMIKTAMDASEPQLVQYGDYHLPYVTRQIMQECRNYCNQPENKYSHPITIAKKISASCCAQVSYRTNDTSIPKALSIYDKLMGQEQKHASPVEHQARPMINSTDWSGNFRGWISYRKDLELTW